MLDTACNTKSSTNRKLRVLLSCDPCRRSKLKCLRQTPICSTCTHRGLTRHDCTYDTKRRKSDNFSSLRTKEDEEKDNEAMRTRRSVDEGRSELRSDRFPTDDLDKDGTEPREKVAETSIASSISIARKVLPINLIQIDAILDTYFQHIGPILPIHNTSTLRQLIKNFWRGANTRVAHPYNYDLSDEKNVAALLAWICAAFSVSLEILPPVRLLIWGVAHDASSIASLASRFSKAAAECYLSSQEAGATSLLLLQSGIALVSSPIRGIPQTKSSAILDSCIRMARKLGLDRLGPCSTDYDRSQSSQSTKIQERMIGRAIWLSLVSADWNSALYLGSYSIFPNTFTTTWDLTIDDVIDEKSQDPWLLDLRSMSFWPWLLRVACVSRQLCELGTHSVSDRKRNNISYDKITQLDAEIQLQIDERPNYYVPETKKEHTSPAVRALYSKHPPLRQQAFHLCSSFNDRLLSLHLPYLLEGYGGGRQTPQYYSTERAVIVATKVVRGISRMMSKNCVLDRTWRNRLLLFHAGLVLLLDLLLRCSKSRGSLDPGIFDSDGVDEKLAFVIDRLKDPAILSNHEQTCGLNLSGWKLEKLLIDGLGRLQDRSEDSILPATVQEYTGNLADSLRYGSALGFGTKNHNPPSFVPFTSGMEQKYPPSYSSEPRNYVSASFNALKTTGTSATNAETIPPPPSTDVVDIDSLLAFADNSAGISVETILSDPFLSKGLSVFGAPNVSDSLNETFDVDYW